MTPTLPSRAVESDDLRDAQTAHTPRTAQTAEALEHAGAPVTHREFGASTTPPSAHRSSAPSPQWTTYWYVYQADGLHVGPLSTELVARGVLTGRIHVGTHVGAAGGMQWWPLHHVAEIMYAVEALRSSGAVK